MLMLMSVLKLNSSLSLIESASQSGQITVRERAGEREKTATDSIKISSKICKNAPKAKRNEAKEKYYS